MVLGGEPTIHLPAALELAASMPDEAYLIWKTNAHGSAQARAWLDGLFDLWLADFKFGNDACAERLSRIPHYLARVQENLRWAAGEAARSGVDVLIEAINPRDVPRYFLNRQDHAHSIVREAGLPNLKVQMDLYHCQIVEGDVAMKIRKYLPTGRVGHLQIAGVPGRHEPDIGEMNYPYLFSVIDEVSAASGWNGWIGCEYRPLRGGEPGGTSAGLQWLSAVAAPPSRR